MTKYNEREHITDPNAYFETHPDFYMCRQYGHQWRPTHDDYIPVGNNPMRPEALMVRLACPGCGCTAEDDFHPVTLERIGHRRPRYSDGYLAEGHRITRTEARMWTAQRQGFGPRARRRRRAG